jgi:hypothetical protein
LILVVSILSRNKAISFVELPNVCSGSFGANLSVSSPSIHETFDLTSVIENSENRKVENNN